MPTAVVRSRPRGAARLVELVVVAIAVVAAISTTMPLIDALEWDYCGGDRETYDVVYGGVFRLAYVGFFVPPLVVAARSVRVLGGDRAHGWGWLVDAFATVASLLALLFALGSKQDVGRDLVIVSHALLLGVLALGRPAVLIVEHRRQASTPSQDGPAPGGDPRGDPPGG